MSDQWFKRNLTFTQGFGRQCPSKEPHAGHYFQMRGLCYCPGIFGATS